MNSNLDHQLRDHLEHYLAGECTLQEFGDWFAAASLNVHLTGNALADDLAGEIGLALAEYSNGDWSDEQLHDLLRPLLAPDWRPQPEHLPQPRSA